VLPTPLDVPFFGQRLPVYPWSKEVVRVTGPADQNGVYQAFLEQQMAPRLSLRDRVRVWAWEPNGIPVPPGIYRGRLVGAYPVGIASGQALGGSSSSASASPLYVISRLCCVPPRLPAKPSAPSSSSPFPLPVGASSSSSSSPSSSSSSSSPSSSSSVSPSLPSSSQSGERTPCCPGVVLPDKLIASVTSTTNCPNLTGLTFPIYHYFAGGPCNATGNQFTGYWIGSILTNTGLETFTVAIRCSTVLGNHWELWAVCDALGQQCPPSTGYPYQFSMVSCNPFDLVANLGTLDSCCGIQSNATITITE